MKATRSVCLATCLFLGLTHLAVAPPVGAQDSERGDPSAEEGENEDEYVFLRIDGISGDVFCEDNEDCPGSPFKVGDRIAMVYLGGDSYLLSKDGLSQNGHTDGDVVSFSYLDRSDGLPAPGTSVDLRLSWIEITFEDGVDYVRVLHQVTLSCTVLDSGALN